MLRAVSSCSNDPVRLENEDNLPLYLCTECARQLLNCARFRTRSLRAHLVMLEIIKKHDCITLESIQSVLGPSLHSSHLTHNQTDQDDLHMELVEEPDIPSSCEDIPVDSIKAEIVDVDLDTLYIVTNQDILKHENVNEHEFVKDEDAMCDGVVDTPSLHGDTVLNDVKEELTNVEDLQWDPMEGGDYSSDDSRPLAEVALTAKLSATAVQQVAKPPEDLNHTKIDSRPKPGADGGLPMDDKLSCDICHYEAVNVARLKSHLEAHAATKSYSCSVCKYITIKKTQLTRHIKVHFGDKAHTCDVCNKSFFIKSMLKIHLRTHSGDRPYTCNVCNKSFSEVGTLQRHLRTHSGEKPYTCDVCNKTFCKRSTLQIHLRTHSGEKPYTCEVCNKSFSHRGNKQKHLQIHSGEKPYTCTVCNKSFSESGTLQKHLRTHSGVKPFTCTVCNKSFSESGNLQRHLRIHSGEKPYTCDVCSKTFTESGGLHKHVLRTHSEEQPHT